MDEEEKEVTVMLQFRTGDKNLDALKEIEDIIIEEGKGMEEPEYYDPAELTRIKLGYASDFPKNINIKTFERLRRRYPNVEEWIESDIFKKLDLSNGERNRTYYGRVTMEDSGRIAELRDKYFYNPYGDNLLVACTLLAIDTDSRFNMMKKRYEKPIRELRKHFGDLEENYNQNFEDILNGLLVGRCGTYHMPIFIRFIHELVVGNEEAQKIFIKTHKDSLIKILQYFVEIQLKVTDENVEKEVSDIVSAVISQN